MTDWDDFHVAIVGLSIAFILIIIMFTAINVGTILYYWKACCRSTTHLLICNSCATLFYYAVTTAIQLACLPTIDLVDKDHSNTIFCQLRAALSFSACVSCALSYLIQAISRYFITILYTHRTLLTFRTNGILIVSSWLISLILPALMFISPVAYQYEPESRACVLTTKVFHTSFPAVMMVFSVPLNVIVCLYLTILRQSTRQNLIHPNAFRVLRMKRNLKVFRNILISVMILTVGGMPSFLCIIINKLTEVPWQLRPLAALSISLSAALNSLALFCLNKKVRTLFFGRVRCQRNQLQSPITQTGHTIPQRIRMSSSMM